MYLKYFLYGHGPNCAKRLTRIQDIRNIEFDISIIGGAGFNGNFIHSNVLYRHYLDYYVARVCRVQGNRIWIEIR